MRASIVFIALAATGCDAVFGLTESEVSGPDAPMRDGMQCTTLQTDDEDLDGIVDGCDNCPADVNPDQDDLDNDGVGDPCDPHPEVSGDRIVLFEGFSDPLKVDAAWQPHGGTWKIHDGVLEQTNKTDYFSYLLEKSFTNPTVSIVMTDQLPFTNVFTEAGVFTGISPTEATSNPDGSDVCTTYVGSAGNPLLLLQRQPGQVPKDQSGFPAGDVTRIRMSSAGTCRGLRDMDVVVNLAYPTTAPRPGYIGLHVAHTSAVFRSVLVIETDQP